MQLVYLGLRYENVRSFNLIVFHGNGLKSQSTLVLVRKKLNMRATTY